MFKLIKLIIIFVIVFSKDLLCMEHVAPIHVPPTVKNLPPGVIKYLEQLPRIEESKEEITAKDIAPTITKFLCAFTNSKKQLIGTESFAKKVNDYIEKDQPVRLHLLGFTGKSANDESKVLSPNIELAELVGLLTLYHMCGEIKSIYKPGAQITLYTREPFLDEVSLIVKNSLGIPLFPEKHIENYQLQLKQLISYFNPAIKHGEITDFDKLYTNDYVIPRGAVEQNLSGLKTFLKEELKCSKITEAARATLFKKNYEQLKIKYPLNDIKDYNDLKCNKKLYNKILPSLQTNILLRSIEDDMARCLAYSVARLRDLMTDKIPDYSHIRLTIRPADNGDVSTKISVGLIHGSEGTPWHNILAVNEKNVALKSRNLLATKMQNLPAAIKYYDIGDQKLAYVQE